MEKHGSAQDQVSGQKRKSCESEGEEEREEKIPKLEQQRLWAIQSGARSDAEILPTHQPKNPAEITPRSDQGWLVGAMETVQNLTWDAVQSYFQDFGIAPAATSRFRKDPPEGLQKLYEKVLGGSGWKEWVREQKLSHGGVALRQDYVVFALFGAAIHQRAFSASLPWDVASRIEKALGRDHKYLRKAVDNMGHKLSDVQMYTAGEQIQDPEFHKEVLPHAKKLAEDTATTLQVHLQVLVKSDLPGTPINFAPWIQSLEEAFEQAILIKQTMRYSKHGKFSLKWIPAGAAFNKSESQKLFPAGKTSRVVHTVLPGFYKTTSSGDVYFWKALVVPELDASVSNQASEETDSVVEISAKMMAKTTQHARQGSSEDVKEASAGPKKQSAGKRARSAKEDPDGEYVPPGLENEE